MAVTTLSGGLPGTPRVAAAARRARPRNVRLWVGVAIVAVVVAAALAAPLLTAHDPTDQDLLNTLAGPSATHPLGTDQLGRDIWSRLLYGARTDLGVAGVAVLAPFVLGTVIGAAAGYFGGWVDTVAMRLADVMVAFPFYVLVIALVFALGGGVSSIYIAITAVGWVAYARIVRGEVLVLRGKEFINACRLSGFSNGRILARHVVPNSMTQAVVFAMSDIVMDILIIVTLGYFGLGITPPTPDWGQMMADGQQFMASGHYALTAVPGTAVVITGFGLSLVGDGLARAMRATR